MREPSFEGLLAEHDWRPIPRCPGRFTLAGGVVRKSIEELVGARLEVVEKEFPGAADPVCFAQFPGGGLISYRKPSGYLHTLCDEAGLQRKLEALRGGAIPPQAGG